MIFLYTISQLLLLLIHPFTGYDKLKPYGFPIHGAVDGFSRRILWLEVVHSNNDPKVPASFYLNQVKELGGCPLLLVSDCGTENGMAAAMQCTFRAEDQDELAGEKSHRYCSSPANQRIEGWRSFYRRNRSNWWISLFKDMVDYGLLHLGNALHMECLWFCFSRLLQDDLNKVRDHWNSHKISKSAYTVLYMGYQMLCIFYLNIMHTKNVQFLFLKNRRRRWKCTAKERWMALYEEYFEYVLETEGRVYPGTVKEALTLYQHIITTIFTTTRLFFSKHL